MKLTTLYRSKSRWTKGHYALDKNGNIVDFKDEKAACFCLAGAIRLCYGTDFQPMVKIGQLISKYLKDKKLMTDLTDYVTWNDDPKTTFTMVRKLVRELRI